MIRDNNLHFWGHIVYAKSDDADVKQQKAEASKVLVPKVTTHDMRKVSALRCT